jgi:two-component system, sporulation sensor kinase D
LAASTAHEIRNPLTGIKGLIQLLSEKYQTEKDQQYFSVINQEINRINQIVSEFLILGKPTIQKREIIDIREIFLELRPLIESEAMLSNITWSHHFPSQPVHIVCSKDQMKQVILNVVKNAFESMNGGGTLLIEVSNIKDKCNIKITDSGIGIPKENLAKLFDPFYTLKESGTGLGLAVCKTIIQSFGGSIQITSEENKGTVVNIYLPLNIEKTSES